MGEGRSHGGQKVNVLSLFTGVGGADLGLERAGMEIIGQCEVNASARKILERHWPDVPLSEDITQLDEDWLLSHGIATRNHPAEGKTVDLVVGGFPNGGDPEEQQILTSTLKANGSGGHRIDAEAAAGNQLIPEPASWPRDTAPTLNAAYATKHGLENQHALSGAGLFVPETVGTLTTRISSDGVSEVDGELYVQSHPERVRRLTPTECERLQGFPDGWTIADPEAAAGPEINPAPDTPRYHQMGNAITVPVAEWIGHRIIHQNQKEEQTND